MGSHAALSSGVSMGLGVQGDEGYNTFIKVKPTLDTMPGLRTI